MTKPRILYEFNYIYTANNKRDLIPISFFLEDIIRIYKNENWEGTSIWLKYEDFGRIIDYPYEDFLKLMNIKVKDMRKGLK